jgi:hypothetical protein
MKKLLITCCAISLLMAAQAGNPTIGSHATPQFQHGGHGELALGRTKAACEALTKAAVIGDKQGFMLIATTKSVSLCLRMKS